MPHTPLPTVWQVDSELAGSETTYQKSTCSLPVNRIDRYFYVMKYWSFL